MIAIAWSLSQMGTAAVSPTIPIEDFAASPSLRVPQVSPDGKRIAALATVKDSTRIVIVDAERPQAVPFVADLGDIALGDIHWAGDKRLLLETITPMNFYGVVIPLGRMMILDIATGQSRLADPRSKGIYGGDVLYADPTGSWALLASQDSISTTPSVKRVDLATGMASVAQKPLADVWDWYVDANGVIRGGAAYNERRWKLYYRGVADEPFRILRGKFDRNEDSSVDRFLFGRDGRTGVIITNERTGRFGAYAYDFEAGALGAPLFESPTVDISEAILSGLTNDVIGVRYHDDKWRTFWLDPALKSLQARLDKALPGKSNLILGDPGEKQRILVLSSGASAPGTYFLLDRKTWTMNPVIQPYDRIDPALLSDVRPTTYTARD